MPEFRSGKPYCHLQLVTGYNQAAGTQTIVFDAVLEDPPGQGTIGPGSQIEVERSGLYLVTWGVGRGTVASSSQITSAVRINGDLFGGDVMAASAGAGQVSGARTGKLDVGDIVTLTSALHGTLSAPVQARPTFLNLDRIGPVKWTG